MHFKLDTSRRLCLGQQISSCQTCQPTPHNRNFHGARHHSSSPMLAIRAGQCVAKTGECFRLSLLRQKYHRVLFVCSRTTTKGLRHTSGHHDLHDSLMATFLVGEVRHCQWLAVGTPQKENIKPLLVQCFRKWMFHVSGGGSKIQKIKKIKKMLSHRRTALIHCCSVPLLMGSSANPSEALQPWNVQLKLTFRLCCRSIPFNQIF